MTWRETHFGRRTSCPFEVSERRRGSNSPPRAAGGGSIGERGDIDI
jgi:hypothetical protein